MRGETDGQRMEGKCDVEEQSRGRLIYRGGDPLKATEG